MEKSISCVCGGSAKLVKRTNYPFGKGSGGRTTIRYKCASCGKEQFPNKFKEVRR